MRFQKIYQTAFYFLLTLSFSLLHAWPVTRADIDTSINLTDAGKRIYQAHRLSGEVPNIDGRLDDVCWQQGVWSGNFTQQIPTEGDPPTAETALKILYDNENIYVGIIAYDDPELVDRQMARRDAFAGDIVGVALDSYHDCRTAFEFNLTAAGSKIDLILMNDDIDRNWDPVWEGKVAQTDSGWTAEMRIPLSQLRYGNQKEQVWGLHAWRWINRNWEEDQWALIPRDTPGRLYDIGELHGIRNLPKSLRIEILPYVRGNVHIFEKEQSNPFATGSETASAFGLNGKIGVSSDFTLDFTINPDFGQVEADPSVLNLSAFETFYEEKRPFFLEGKNILDFSFGRSMLFYSRRIGHKPSYTPELGDNEYAKTPENTSILGAVKLTGKSKDGLSLGILESVTANEYAQIATPEGKFKKKAEPLTNFIVGRVQKEYNGSNTILGGIMTATNRRIQDKHLNYLNREAYTGGLDFRHYWKNKKYYIDAQTVYSHIAGSRQALLELQTSSARYFQRPDAEYVTLDSSRTHLSGYGVRVEIGKGGRGHWRYDFTSMIESPGLELNDIGYMRSADDVTSGFSLSYVEDVPKGWFRNYAITFGEDNAWTYGGDFRGAGAFLRLESQFSNKWRASYRLLRDGDHLDTYLLRGGPAVLVQGHWCNLINLSTDRARKFYASIGVHKHIHDDGITLRHDLMPEFGYKVTSNLQIETELNYGKNRDPFQYVLTENVNGRDRYLLAHLDRKTLGLTMRMDLALTPELTIQYYGNPYFSVGTYSHFKYINHPRAENYDRLYDELIAGQLKYNEETNEYSVDENKDGITDYVYENPNFNFREFRSNLVMRWEFQPGSTLFLVWTHGRSAWETVTNMSLSNNANELFASSPDNIFLVKLNYWFSI